ncbi:hypothetical protein [Sulfurimonas sp.]|uniref:hypothetical protein n=1 Tax=Sulfurimonas sp. TaxID=2022749 RepID=UPI002B4861AC|nr:hypothetical protein [Sulfurimonas sp.]
MNKTEMANLLKMDYKTFRNWENGRPEVFEIIIKHFENKKEYPDLNNPNYLKSEMIKAIDKLSENKTKKFYHLMMAELAEMGH